MQIDHENEMHEIRYVDGDRDWEDLEAMEYTVSSQSSYKDTSRSNETRNSRLNWVRGPGTMDEEIKNELNELNSTLG